MDSTTRKPPQIPMTACQSSQFCGYGYDEATRTLVVQFHPRKSGKPGAGSIYHYAGVTPETWGEFQAAESKGSYFIAKIKAGGYAYERIDDTTDEG